MTSAPILEGLKVVELSAFVAAPLGGATLASLGAEVIRIDPPGGGIDAKRWPLKDGESIYWSGLNAGKRSLCIDTRSPAGQELATSLIAEAGIVLTNLRVHGWNEYERLRERRPDLIMAVLTGNPDGSTAVDYTVNAAVGFPFVTGPADLEGPVNHVLPAWDALAGYMLAAGLIAAELRRVRTGEGQYITLSLADIALSIAGNLGYIGEATLLPDQPRQRVGNDLFGSYSRDFRTSDGHYVIAVALTTRQWASLIEATGIAEGVRALEAERGVDLRDEGVRYALRREIGALVEPWVAAHTLAEVREAFDRHEVLWGPYQTFVELVANDPRCSPANPMFAEVDQPGLGRFLRPAAPLAFSGAPRVPPRTSPRMGGDTRDVLRGWLGLSEDEIARLAAERVI
ncbi:MAG: CoA transferase [Dehalococcoidia bacterium]